MVLTLPFHKQNGKNIGKGMFKKSEVFDVYWRFAEKRQEIFFKQVSGLRLDLTDDPILKLYKFTNTYRAADRVSQYLIKHVIYDETASRDNKEVFFRILLFKMFNKIETWEFLKKKIGVLSYKDYDFKKYDKLLSECLDQQVKIFSAAYIMPSGRQFPGYKKKHQNCLEVLNLMMKDDVPGKVSQMNRMSDVFDLLKTYPMIGDFLAYQYAIDINYSLVTNFSENNFVVPGPGAKRGIAKCVTDKNKYSDTDIIKYMVDEQENEFKRLGLHFKTLWGRPLHLIDCQNIFCEVDKYLRVFHPELKLNGTGKRIKQKYVPNMKKIDYWFPPKWKINMLINKKT